MRNVARYTTQHPQNCLDPSYSFSTSVALQALVNLSCPQSSGTLKNQLAERYQLLYSHTPAIFLYLSENGDLKGCDLVMSLALSCSMACTHCTNGTNKNSFFPCGLSAAGKSAAHYLKLHVACPLPSCLHPSAPQPPLLPPLPAPLPPPPPAALLLPPHPRPPPHRIPSPPHRHHLPPARHRHCPP